MIQQILVAYVSVSGSTAEVAEAIADELSGDDVHITLQAVREVMSVEPYQAVVLGSSIRAGHWLPEAANFLQENAETLSQKKVAYFTTCLTMQAETNDARRVVLGYMQPLQYLAPAVNPVGLGLFAGSLDPTRLAMNALVPDLAPQGDYRNWETIRAWARDIRPALLAPPVPATERLTLRDAILSYTDMKGHNLSQADLLGATLDESNLSEANLQGSILDEASLREADLRYANLHEASLNWADINWAKMSGANLFQANLIGADLQHAILDQANLSQTILNGANLSQANLKQADLSHCDLNWAVLRQANLSEANLQYANLSWANFDKADLTGANLDGAVYNHQTEWPEGFSPEEAGCILVDFS